MWGQMKTYDFCITNCDTDSISFRKKDGSEFTQNEQKQLIDEINSILPIMIEYEDDGYFQNVLITKAKNYVLYDGKKVKYKGSSLTDSKKEPALKEMLNRLIEDIMFNESKSLTYIYHNYIKEAANIKDISRWCTKKSISAKVLNPSRTNEQKILNAVSHLNPREGDKYLLYSALDGMTQDVKKGEPVFLKSGKAKMVPNKILKVDSEWCNDEDMEHYLKRVYMTLEILKNVIDMGQFIKYHLKSNIGKVEKL